MYLGRYLLGTEIPLTVLCVDGAGDPGAPTAAPVCDVYSTTGKVVAARAMPPLDRYGATGLFRRRQFLGADFATGQYQAVYRYTLGSYLGVVIDTFEVIAGGNAGGTPIAMYYYRRPNAAYLVQHLDSGRVVKQRNPYL